MKKNKGNIEENGITKSIETRKQKIAGWLNNKTQNISVFQQKIGLFIFCGLFGSFCFYLLAGAICNSPLKPHVLVVTHLHSGVRIDSSRVHSAEFKDLLNPKK